MSSNGVGTVERAFQLAKSGECHSIDDIRRQLAREQCTNIDAHLAGSSIRRQLVQEIAIKRNAPK